MKRRPCICGHDKSGHQRVEIKLTPVPCLSCGCKQYRAATRRRIADLAAQRPLFPEGVKP